jgi:hypothetical protein
MYKRKVGAWLSEKRTFVEGLRAMRIERLDRLLSVMNVEHRVAEVRMVIS